MPDRKALEALRKAVLVLVAALLVWRIASIGMSAHYAARLKSGDTDAADKALAWNGQQPRALYRLGVGARERDPETAASNLLRAFAGNPADARPLLAMASLAQARGEQDRSEALVKAAVDLAPSDPRVHKGAAAYWISRGDVEQSLRHWSRALENDPGLSNALFPVLLKLAEDPRTGPAFEPLAASPPSWWEGFFDRAAKNARDLSTVRLLYNLRRASSGAPVTRRERQAYVARLMKDGITAEAYVDWINGLTTDQRRRLASIYDGGFELDPGNWGFGWRIRSIPSALVDRAHTYGVDGDAALHLLFENHKTRFQGVFQSLFLDPGPYRITGKVRTDSLTTNGGLKWLVRCLQPEASDLGESERFLGANEWSDFAFEFEVPDSCMLQEIRLVSAGRRRFEHEITGGAWFDRLALRKIAKLARPPNTALKGAAKETSTAPEPPPAVTLDLGVTGQ